MSTSDIKYTVALDAAAKIPMTVPQIRALFAKGQLPLETELWREGMADWSTVEELRDELDLPPLAPRGMPPPRRLAPPPREEMPGAGYFTREKPAPRNDGTPIGALLLMAVGIIVGVYFLTIYDVGVATEMGRVVNMQRMQDRTLGAGAGGLLLLIGVIVAVMRKRE